LVSKGFSQQLGIDYGETFSPIEMLDMVRNILSIVAQNKCQFYQLDVKSSFFNDILQQEVYVDQPHGFEVKVQKDTLYMLKKLFHGSKKSPSSWYNRIESYIIKSGFNRSSNEPNLYTKSDHEGKIIIVCLYVDDMIYTINTMLEKYKVVMKTEFDMIDIGLMKCFWELKLRNPPMIFLFVSKIMLQTF
jgi:hypothetical protein